MDVKDSLEEVLERTKSMSVVLRKIAKLVNTVEINVDIADWRNVSELVWRRKVCNFYYYYKKGYSEPCQTFNPPCPDPGRREKINLLFIFTLLCGVSKGFMKAFKAFIKPGLHKILLGTTKKCENKNLSLFLF